MVNKECIEHGETFSVDSDYDAICDACEAHSVARILECRIMRDMEYHHNVVKKGNIDRPNEYLTKHLSRIQDKWIKEYSKMIPMPKYEYWQKKLTNRVVFLTQHLGNQRVEEPKKYKQADY